MNHNRHNRAHRTRRRNTW